MTEAIPIRPKVISLGQIGQLACPVHGHTNHVIGVPGRGLLCIPCLGEDGRRIIAERMRAGPEA